MQYTKRKICDNKMLRRPILLGTFCFLRQNRENVWIGRPLTARHNIENRETIRTNISEIKKGLRAFYSIKERLKFDLLAWKSGNNPSPVESFLS